jgi:16S rRNA (guanine527-N7)-methyltransferase
MNKEVLEKHFPEFSSDCTDRLEYAARLYSQWNQKINLISRKDIDFIYERHILHSLLILKYIQFIDNQIVIDVGSGGGFPGLPLAIACPTIKFVLLDSIQKKINVLQSIIDTLGLTNVTTICSRAENHSQQYDWVTGRAVAPLATFYTWAYPLLKKNKKGGILYLKGGEVANELKALQLNAKVWKLSDFSDLTYFESKVLIYLPN